jgi:hypothetical protein
MDRCPDRASVPAARALRRALAGVAALALFLLSAPPASAHPPGPNPWLVWLYGRPASTAAPDDDDPLTGGPLVEEDGAAGVTVFGSLQTTEGATPDDGRVRLHPTFEPNARRGAPGDGTDWLSVGADGRFEIADLPAGRFTLEARAEGCGLLVARGLEVPAADLVTAQRGVDLGTFTLPPGAGLSGHVVDADGTPVAGAVLRPSPASPETPRPRSDETGAFSFGGYVPGERLSLVVQADGYAESVLDQVPVPQADLVVVLQPPATVVGTVVDSRGEPAAGERVHAFPIGLDARSRGHGSSLSTSSDEAGRFEIAGLPAGRFAISTSDSQVQVELTAGQRRDGLRLVVLPTIQVRGRVTDEADRPVHRCVVSAVRFHSSGSRHGISVTTDRDGRYTLPVRTTRDVDLSAVAEGYLPHHVALDATAGADRQVDFRLHRTGGALAGTVVDAEGLPVAGAEVAFRHADPGGPSDRNPFPHSSYTTAGPDGRFSWPHVLPGRYRLTATAGYRSGEVDGVEVGDTPVDGVVVRLRPSATLVGEVRGAAPRELAALVVEATSLQPEPTSRAAQVDHDGSYRLPGLEGGRWRVAVAGDDVWGHPRDITLPDGGGEVRLDLDVGGGSTLAGVVTRNGAPAVGELLTLRRAPDGGTSAAHDPAHRGTDPDLAGAVPTGEVSRTASDFQGRFRFTHLPAGRYLLGVPAWRHEQVIDVEGDRELAVDVATATVAGRVVDGSGRPVPDVEVEVIPAADPPRTPGTTRTPSGLFWAVLRIATRTGLDGGFTLVAPAGEARLTAGRDGFETLETTLRLPPGGRFDDLELLLLGTPGAAP